MRKKRLIGLCAGLLAVCLAVPAGAAELTVSAAASLKDAFTDIKGAFEAQHPGVKVYTNFAASNPLLKQMKEGAPVDVFAPADQETMNQAQAAGLIDPATRRDFALNDLVLIVPADGKAGTETFRDGLAALKDASFRRIAVGKPESVPAGRYARDALTAASLWEPLQDRLVFGQNVRQVLDYVARGEVEAGFVYGTDALSAGDKVRIAAVVSGHNPVLYPLAVAVTGKNAKDGAVFADFVAGPEGRAILEKYGFNKP